MNWRREWKPLAIITAVFLALFYLPLSDVRVQNAFVEALALAKWYAQEHVVLCLIPAFFIAGAIAVFVGKASVMKYLGAQANRIVSYAVASVSGSILAVCSCTVLPLFAGIYRMGAGLGPATAFLYAGPAINVLAIILTARVLGLELGIARAVQEMLAENSQHGGAKARNKHNALLKGLLYCGSCGAAMAHTYTKRKDRLYRYYVCTTAQKQGSAACATPSLPAQDIEDAVVEQIRQIANEPEMVEQVFAEAEQQRKANIPKLKVEQKRLQRERQHKQERIKELVAAIGQSKKPLASVSESLEELETISAQVEQRLIEIQEELDAITRNPVDLADLTSALALFGPVWEELWPGERMRVLRIIIDRLTYLSASERIGISFKS